jgi:deoxycytidylate deaminase
LTLIAAAGIKNVVYLEAYRGKDKVDIVAKEYGINMVEFPMSGVVSDLVKLLPLEEKAYVAVP